MKVIIEFRRKENKMVMNQLYVDVKDIELYDDWIKIHQQNEVEEMLNINRITNIPKEAVKALDISGFFEIKKYQKFFDKKIG